MAVSCRAAHHSNGHAGTADPLTPKANVAARLSDSVVVLGQAAFDPYGRPEKVGSSQRDSGKSA